ncbi:MAG: hypothetical protein PHS93_04430 [Candidatus Omnitrophica bacterium]|nr:hypothetical protein [Candidatus Omnitrophota bacterium]MDD5352397.1 hypothetical protein [Candidatus Omnitrophota bacterium]
MAEVAKRISLIDIYEVIVFSSKRHLSEDIGNGKLLREFLDENNIKFFSEDNINKSKLIDGYIDKSALGIAFGASWVFEKKFVRKFHKPLLDFMGIDLPRYRGGAHYSWQILFNNKKGCCNLQIIEGGEDKFHKGPIIKRKIFTFDRHCCIPIDYFNQAVPIERDFIVEFLNQVKYGKEFKKNMLNEKESTYYPFLHTLINGWINWNWNALEITKFICAFDEPYRGASTRINNKRVFLKKVFLEKRDKDIHPFSAGIVVHKDKKFIRVLAKEGTLRVEKVIDENNNDLMKNIKLGDRFYSLTQDLEKAITFKATYSSKGLKNGQ